MEPVRQFHLYYNVGISIGIVASLLAGQWVFSLVLIGLMGIGSFAQRRHDKRRNDG